MWQLTDGVRELVVAAAGVLAGLDPAVQIGPDDLFTVQVHDHQVLTDGDLEMVRLADWLVGIDGRSHEVVESAVGVAGIERHPIVIVVEDLDFHPRVHVVVGIVDADKDAAVCLPLGAHLEIQFDNEVAIATSRAKVAAGLGRVEFALGIDGPASGAAGGGPGVEVLAVEEDLPPVLVDPWLILVGGLPLRRGDFQGQHKNYSRQHLNRSCGFHKSSRELPASVLSRSPSE